MYGVEIPKESLKRWKLLPPDLEDRGEDGRDITIRAFCNIPCRVIFNCQV